MGDITIDSKTFHERISRFATAWRNDLRSKDASVFNGASSIVIMMGKAEDSGDFHKNNAIHFWLLGYEFPTTLVLFTTEKLYILTTAKKAKHLVPLKDGRFPIEILTRGKDAAENEKLWTKVTDTIKASGKKVGVLTKDTSAGPFIDEWKKTFETNCKDIEQVDIAAALSIHALAVKDEDELRAMRTSSKACVALMTPYLLDEMSDVLDEEKKVKHRVLAKKVEDKIEDNKFWKKVELPDKNKMPADMDPIQLDWVITPVIQSGGKYDLRLGVESNDDNLHAGVIIASMGLRYKSYCSSIARTYLIDPKKNHESNYKLLHQMHNTAFKAIRDGTIARDVYNTVVDFVKSKRPGMEKHMAKNVGYGLGLETRDPTLILSAKNSRILKDGMTICVTTSLANIVNDEAEDKQSQTYSMMISDTIRVTTGEPIIFTAEAPVEASKTSFFFKDDAAEIPVKKEKKDSRVGAVATKNITKTRLRSERSTQVDDEAEKRRREHQKELLAKLTKEGLARYAEDTSGADGVEEKKFKKYESYKRDNQIPPKAKNLEIVVDQKNATVVLPIMGRPVPFHINTIKNVSTTDEGEFSFLRVNFLSPGQGVGRKDEQPFEDANANFIRSLSFRSDDKQRYEEIVTAINNMKRDNAKKEQEKKDMADVVEQDKLVEIRNRRPAVLDNVFIRPAMEGKRVAGKIEIHQNGIRYVSPLSAQQRIDVLFSNIKHLFFQPCDHELVVIIHIHLKDPIIVGNKKKTKDVQFYREATDIQFDETGNRRRKYRYGDEDEFEQEQEERKRRAELDRLFQGFAHKIADAGKDHGLEVDTPMREIGFHGVPFRSNVFIQPTTDTLMQVVEPPFMVLTLDEIEIAHLERVQFGLKNFDLVFVFKDYSRTPYHINTIPVEYLETVKDWLDSCNILYSEGPLNLSWAPIMKTVTTNPHQFFVDGGWSFLQENDEEDGGSEESDEESAFEVDSDDLDAASESSEDESDYGSGVSDEDSDFDSDAEEEEEGEDWDELERKAKRKDRESNLSDSETDRGGGKRRRR